MKKLKRTLTILVAAVMLVSLLTVPAMADLEYFFQANWSAKDNGDNTGSITVTLSHIYAGTKYSTPNDGADFRQNFKDLKPQVLIEKDGVELKRVDIPAPGSSAATVTCTVTLSGAGAYEATVIAKDYGKDGMITGGFFDGMLYPTGGMTFDLGGTVSGGGTDGVSDIHVEYIAILEGYLRDAGISGKADLVAALKDQPEAISNELHWLIMDFNSALEQHGTQSLGEYAKTYQKGKYAALIAYLEAYEGGMPAEPETPLFTDVRDDAWYAVYVYVAADLGLVKGTGDGTTFSPGNNLSYAEAITLAARMHALYGEQDEGKVIGKAGQGQAWYQPYVDYAKKVGIPWQYSDYTAKVTREEYVHIFYAAMPKDAYGKINEVANGTIPDIAMNHKYADEIYILYRAGILTGSDAAGTFNPKSSITRSEVATIVCRMMLQDFRQEID